MSLILQLTKDNSHTLYVTELDETYHSVNGAIEEAMYVYIGKGLLDFIQYSENKQQKISILEIGFGTGLNTWLTALETKKIGINCSYQSIEANPLPIDIISKLNYTTGASTDDQELFTNIHSNNWNESLALTSQFTLTKSHVTLQNFEPTQTFDIIYFDAFAPEKQPELWTQVIFEKLYACLNSNGVIVTYSSKGDIKRMWRSIGFNVERLQGPPSKRHMLRGRKLDTENK